MTSSAAAAIPVAGDGMAPLALAIGLPRTPAAAVALLLILLTISYVLLTIFIRVGVPSPTRAVDADEDTAPDSHAPEDNEPWDEEQPVEDAAREPEYLREPLIIEAVRVRDVLLTVGDTASSVMAAFRPGEGETMPMVQRGADGRACHVSRTYRVGRRTLTLIFEREAPPEPLRLIRIEPNAS